MPTIWIQKIRKFWKADEIHGFERFCDIILLALMHFSISYWLKDVWLNLYLNKRRISDAQKRRIRRDNIMDGYCIFQAVVLFGVLVWFGSPALSWCVATYVLFEIYLNLFSIFFLPRQKEIGPLQSSDTHAAVNEPSTSVERSILLLFVNMLQVTLAFAVFYRNSIPGLFPSAAFRTAVFVFATLAAPHDALGLVTLQIFLDFLLVAAILASFVGQAGPFAKKGN